MMEAGPVPPEREEQPMNRETATTQCIDPVHYAERGYPHEAWAWLRRNEPVAWCEPPGFPPFWAITKHDDVVFLSKQPHRFLNEPTMAIFPSEFYQSDDFPLRHLINMDPPEHRSYRGLISAQFTPRALEPKRAAVEAIVDSILDAAAEKQELDFVRDVSAIMPIAVIAEMLGIPEPDRDQFFHWTNQTIAPEDPEYSQGASARETSDAAIQAQSAYFMQMVAERRASTRDDLVGRLAAARIDGEPIPDFELLSYLVLLVVAGNETTRNAATGGLHALITHPEQLAALRADPIGRIRPAVEEIVRWVTPVNQFCRTSIEDVELRGRKIGAGEAMCLFYASANRDEEIYDDPFAFRIDRWPNRHLGFGIGEHVCMGAHLARLELQILFAKLFERLEHIEPAGELERQRSSFVGGIKRMPVRLRLTP
jgi:cholest-4-en-3-one 26-monooxygenase